MKSEREKAKAWAKVRKDEIRGADVEEGLGVGDLERTEGIDLCHDQPLGSNVDQSSEPVLRHIVTH
jgi:hypothetical protein